MIVLSFLALGILTLSTATLRSAGDESAQLEADGNARLALSLAIGELQKTLGSDRTASAPANAPLDNSAQSHLVGAGESWSWGPLSESQSPNYAATKAPGERARLLVGDGTANNSTVGRQTVSAELVTLQDQARYESGGSAWPPLPEPTKANSDFWCEAIGQRFPEFFDATQSPGTPSDQLNPTNTTFGRKFCGASARWLGHDEV